MKFQDKFKSGDIICSDRFHNGLCMVIESNGISIGGEFRYRCNDLIEDGQSWLAYENEMYLTRPYNWRIATDDDIANYLSRFVNIKLGKVDIFEIKLTDDGITLDDDFNRIKSYVGKALGEAYDLERRVEVLLFRLEEIAESDLIASNLKSMARHAIKEFGNNK